MRNLSLFPILVTAFILLSPGAGSAGALRGDGDFEFFIDVASIPTRSGKTLEFLQIAVPTKGIKYKKNDGYYNAAVWIEVSLKNEKETVFKKGYTIKDARSTQPAARDLSGFLYMSDSCTVAPGEYRMDVRAEDMMGRKKTLMGLIRKNYLSSELKGVFIDVPEFPDDTIALSDPVLIWSREKGKGLIPNPMQIYGLKNDTLSFFVSANVPEYLNVDSLDINALIIDGSDGKLIDEKQARVAVRDGQSSFFGTFDVNVYPAGTYRIVVTADYEGGFYARTGKDFSVAWELVNWQRQRRDMLVEARMLLSESDFEEFQDASLGEQENILRDFWKKLDPTPQTAVNEAREKFFERVNYADAHFKGYTRGALTDRGQIYIRFGPPEQIFQESVPTNRNDLTEAIKKLEDQYDIITHSMQLQFDGYSSIRPKILTSGENRAFRGIEGMDTGAYELWIYNLKGDPILEKDRLMTLQTGFRFLFVDMDGIGEYRMIGTSDEFSD